MIAFQINDMRCGHCERSLTEALSRLDPAARLHFDLGRHRLQIEASTVGAAALAEAIRAAGYVPEQVAASVPETAANAAAQAPVRSGCCCRSAA